MKSCLLIVLALLLALGAAHAGQIYGSFQQGGRSIDQETPFRIACDSGFRRDNLKTDRNGAYRIFVPGRGRCTLTVTFGRDEPEAAIYAYDRPVRYDFELMRIGAGLVLQRR